MDRRSETIEEIPKRKHEEYLRNGWRDFKAARSCGRLMGGHLAEASRLAAHYHNVRLSDGGPRTGAPAGNPPPDRVTGEAAGCPSRRPRRG